MATVDMSSLTRTEDQNEKVKKEKPEKIVVKEEDIVYTKAPVTKKIFSAFIEDGASDIKDYILNDVLIPGVKATILNIISMAFNGEPLDYSGRSSGKRHRRASYTDYTSYSSYYDEDRRGGYRRSSKKEDAKTDYRNIVLRNKRSAMDLVDELRNRIDEEGEVTVAELLEMVHAPSDFPDNNWGWTDENQIGIRKVVDGWLIDVERARYLK